MGTFVCVVALVVTCLLTALFPHPQSLFLAYGTNCAHIVSSHPTPRSYSAAHRQRPTCTYKTPLEHWEQYNRQPSVYGKHPIPFGNSTKNNRNITL